MPISTGNRHNPKTTCISNIKQIGTGLLIYITDYDDRLPPAAGWMDSLQPYLKNENLYHDEVLDLKTDYGYELNQILSLRTLKSFKNPEHEAAIFDSAKLGRSEVGTLGDLPSPGRHDGKNIVGFLDGHVKDR